jgi:4-amino-4-deoxy-L-arabinose transferase-like glycosyltransferase
LTSDGAFVKTRAVSRRNWILLGIVLAATGVRLFQIEQPFVDPWSWRQSDVAAIARNYYTGGFHFAYPQIDWAGDAPGYVGTEFPILPFAAALSYKAVGVHEWLGRVQSVAFFILGALFLFRLVERLFGTPAALWGTFFYAFAPLSVATSRAFMPDMPSLALALGGMFFYVRWLDSERGRELLFAAILVALALLVKVTTALIAAPLFYVTWQRFGPHLIRDRRLWLFAAIALLPSCAWYWHAHQTALRYYPHHFFGAGGLMLENPAWYWRIAKQTALSSLTPVLCVLAVAGFILAPAGRFRRLFHWWAAAMLIFIIVVGWGNRHQWYQLPLVPIAAVFAGCACATIAQQRIALAFLVATFLVSAAFATRPFFAPAAAPLRDAGLALRELSPPNALVLAADDGDPNIFYYAQRKGWHFLEEDGVFYGNPLDDAQLIADYDKLRSRGASYLVFTFGTRWWLQYYRAFAQHVHNTAEPIADRPEFVIYRITANRP